MRISDWSSDVCSSDLTTTGTTPYQAIQRAAAAAPQSIPGPFLLRIQAMAKDSKYTYLNSELDYRDQRNLTIVVTSAAARALSVRMGSDLEAGMIGKQQIGRAHV